MTRQVHLGLEVIPALLVDLKRRSLPRDGGPLDRLANLDDARIDLAHGRRVTVHQAQEHHDGGHDLERLHKRHPVVFLVQKDHLDGIVRAEHGARRALSLLALLGLKLLLGVLGRDDDLLQLGLEAQHAGHLTHLASEPGCLGLVQPKGLPKALLSHLAQPEARPPRLPPKPREHLPSLRDHSLHLAELADIAQIEAEDVRATARARYPGELSLNDQPGRLHDRACIRHDLADDGGADAVDLVDDQLGDGGRVFRIPALELVRALEERPAADANQEVDQVGARDVVPAVGDDGAAVLQHVLAHRLLLGLQFGRSRVEEVVAQPVPVRNLVRCRSSPHGIESLLRQRMIDLVGRDVEAVEHLGDRMVDLACLAALEALPDADLPPLGLHLRLDRLRKGLARLELSLLVGAGVGVLPQQRLLQQAEGLSLARALLTDVFFDARDAAAELVIAVHALELGRLRHLLRENLDSGPDGACAVSVA
mmetsp:Transcript_57336/g.157410  ORF Transcript_57336/g.157410 Transcript_57336/m.157410 type:complete len:480 (-) Transcript_57336:172-1611(-)